MKEYTVTLIETLTRDVVCQVEADSIKQARKKALSGDTISEDIDTMSESITDRTIWEVEEGSEIEEEDEE